MVYIFGIPIDNDIGVIIPVGLSVYQATRQAKHMGYNGIKLEGRWRNKQISKILA